MGTGVSNSVAAPHFPSKYTLLPDNCLGNAGAMHPQEQQVPKWMSGIVHIFFSNYMEPKSPKEIWFTVTHPHCWWHLQKHKWWALPCAPVRKRSLARGGAHSSFWGTRPSRAFFSISNKDPTQTASLVSSTSLLKAVSFSGSCKNRMSNSCTVSWSGEISPCNALPAAPVPNVDTEIKTSQVSFKEVQTEEGKAEMVWQEC